MDANEPFNSSSKADAILRSSDAVDFFVIKLLLCLVSPLFNDMFSSVHITADETRNGLPIIRISEDSATLHGVLFLVYPSYIMVDEPVLHIDNFCKVARAVQKYGMDHIENKLKTIATSSRLLDENAFRVYVLAVHSGWTDIATIAALKSLKTPLCDLPFIEELNLISGADLYNYLVYRSKYDQYEGEGEPPRLMFTVPKTTSAAADDQLPTIVAAIADAPSPFGPSTKVDAVLRSSDHVDFYIKKSFLAFLSPAFDFLFVNSKTMLRKIDGAGQELSIYDVEENSETLFGLLCFLHPRADEPEINKLELFHKIWAAAQKYEVLFIVQRLERSLLSSTYIQEDPLRVFAVGVNLGWRKAIKAAAMNTLIKPLADLVYSDELRTITGASLYRLMEYRFKCVDVVCHLFASMNKYELLENGHVTTTGPQPYELDYSEPSFFTEFSRAVQKRLRECPRGSSVMGDDELLVAVVGTRKGFFESRLRKLLTIRWTLALAIDKEVSKVNIDC